MRRFPQPLEEATGGVRFAGWRPAQFAAYYDIIADPAVITKTFVHSLFLMLS